MLVRYIINLDEGVPYMIPVFEDGEENLTFEEGNQRCKGLHLKVKDGYGSVSWRTNQPILLTGFKIGADYGYQVDPHKYLMDNLDIYIEDKKLFEDKAIFDVDSYTNIRHFMPIKENLEIRFEYKTNTPIGEYEEDKNIWIDIDYLGDPLLKKVKVVCIKEGGNHLKEEDILHIEEYSISRGVYEFLSPKVERYKAIYPTYRINAMPTYGSFVNSVPILKIIEYRLG